MGREDRTVSRILTLGELYSSSNKSMRTKAWESRLGQTNDYPIKERSAEAKRGCAELARKEGRIWKTEARGVAAMNATIDPKKDE